MGQFKAGTTPALSDCGGGQYIPTIVLSQQSLCRSPGSCMWQLPICSMETGICMSVSAHSSFCRFLVTRYKQTFVFLCHRQC